MKANTDIRAAIARAGLKHYEAAALCGVSLYTFSHWLAVEMSEAKKIRILKLITTTNGAEHEQEKENT